MNFYNIERSILIKAIYNAVAETLVKRYEKNGYKVTKEHKIDNYVADLFCQNENESIVIEIRGRGIRNKGSIDNIITNKIKLLKSININTKSSTFTFLKKKV